MITDFAKKIAVETGEIVKNFYGKAKSFDKSGNMNFVTEADLAADKYLKEEIYGKFPSHGIISEEDDKHEIKEHSDLWIIDPLDGTTNFKYQIPFFAVSVAYLKDGKVFCGAVYDPIHAELFWAEKGKGAYLGQTKLTIDNSISLNKAVIGTDGHYETGKFDEKLNILKKLNKYTGTVRILGSAVLDMTYIATNRINLYFDDSLEAWDMAASSLIVEEARGIVKQINGKPLDLFGKNAVATSPKLLEEFINLAKLGN